MKRINIKPLSVNLVWQGKRFKTPAYTKYEREVFTLLPDLNELKPPFLVNITFGLSNSLSDIDNPVKPILDILQKKYGINDKDIIELNLKKLIVKKGFEYFDFEINHLSL